MANQTSINGTVSLGDPQTVQGTFNMQVQQTPTGSNVTIDVPTVTSGAYQPFQTSSLSTMKWAVFLNQGTSSVQLASTSGGAGFNPILGPGDICILPLSGSGGIANSQLWAKTLTTNGANLVQYGIQEF